MYVHAKSKIYISQDVYVRQKRMSKVKYQTCVVRKQKRKTK